MGQKRVVVLFERRPFGTIHYVEGLRAALGIASGWDEHEVELIFLGEGAWYALKNVTRTDALKYLNTLGKLGFGLKVERESVAELGIAEQDVGSEFGVISRDELLAILERADHTVHF